MDEAHKEKLKGLVGKKVIAVAPDELPDQWGFDLVFDDGTTLEVYDVEGLAWRIGKAENGLTDEEIGRLKKSFSELDLMDYADKVRGGEGVDA